MRAKMRVIPVRRYPIKIATSVSLGATKSFPPLPNQIKNRLIGKNQTTTLLSHNSNTWLLKNSKMKEMISENKVM
jgi:hypothetical protein